MRSSLAAAEASSSSLRSSPVPERAPRTTVRSLSPTVMEDRTLAPDIERVAEAIRTGELVAAVEAEAGALA